MRAAQLAVALAALCAATSVRAVESARHWSAEVGAGNYTPNIDDGSFAPLRVGTTGVPVDAGPYEQMFGSGRGWLFRVGFSRALLTEYGSLEVGGQTGFFRRSAASLVNEAAVAGAPPLWKPSGDTTSFNIIPTSITLTYRYDQFVEKFPLAPYVRGTLERYNWWVSDTNGTRMTGATNGWSVTGGVALALDFFDQSLARELDNDTGVNHTFLYFDATKSSVDDFGSKSSWDLSGKDVMLSGGLLFTF
jgi:hypothetical protein